jgi:hypothetical protein
MLNIPIIMLQSHALMFSISVELREYVQMHAVELVPAEVQHVIVGLVMVEQIVQYHIDELYYKNHMTDHYSKINNYNIYIKILY